MIYTTYFAQLKNLPRNMTWVSICRKAPRWYRGRECKFFAPSYELLMDYKENHDVDDYVRRYKAEVLDRTSVDDAIVRLQVLIPHHIYTKLDARITESKNWHIALLCYEKPSDFCHRHLLAQWLRDNGIECKEWTKE